MKLNIYDIAEEAGVSIATVSRVLNNASRVSPKTRQKVLEIMASKQYTPKLMVNKLTNITVMIRGYLSGDRWAHFGPYESTILNGINNICHQQSHVNLQILPHRDDWADEHILKHLQSNKTEGVLFISSQNIMKLDSLLQENNIRTFHCNTRTPTGNHLIVDNQKGTHDMLYQLFSQGHRKIAYVGYQSQNWSESERLETWRQFLVERNIDPKPLEFCHPSCPSSEQGGFPLGFQMAERLLKSQGDTATAVLTQNSEFAGGLIKGLNKANIAIPEQLSIVTFDDFAFLEYMTPSVSTISQPLYQLGEQSAQQLLAQLKGEQRDFNNTLNPTLCMRESTGPAPL